MTKIRTYRPFDAFAELQQMANLFDRAFSATASEGTAPTSLSVPIEVFEHDNRLVIRAAVPGVAPNELDVQIEDGVLTIRGEVKRDHEEKDVKMYRREFAYGSFSRSLRLPDELDLENVDAEFRHGFVTITIPRIAPPAPEVKKVAIRQSE